jgi:hypothetical protein
MLNIQKMYRLFFVTMVLFLCNAWRFVILCIRLFDIFIGPLEIGLGGHSIFFILLALC